METTAFALAEISCSNVKDWQYFDTVWKSENYTGRERNLSIKKKSNFFDSEVDTHRGIYCCRSCECFTFPIEPLNHLAKAMTIILEIKHRDQRPEYEKIIREIDMALFSLDPDTGELLRKLLIEDTTPLPNGYGDTEHDRQIFEIDELDGDPLKSLGGRKKISEWTT